MDISKALINKIGMEKKPSKEQPKEVVITTTETKM